MSLAGGLERAGHRASVVVVFTLMPKRQDVDGLGAFNLVKCDVPTPPQGIKSSRKNGLSLALRKMNGVRLRWFSSAVARVSMVRCAGLKSSARFERTSRKSKKSDQVFTGCVGVSDLEFIVHPSTCLRRASSRASWLARRPRARKAACTWRRWMASRTAVSISALSVSPSRSTLSAAERSSAWTRSEGKVEVFTAVMRCKCDASSMYPPETPARWQSMPHSPQRG